ncbi:hypothetical protein [Amycolatopsis sp. YIM 10]|uniref:hypothetical protein n=1 Tax=Amycolatopsis sp. YIM 10 TaxID=2653857 RepID=UPI00128FEDBA|nr:hypothetical protein [Amycolatopsis sp. YIM 10]QFU87882.1 hypothetical protein YIM_13480 [Amycolatopsis sp. YIM 10]QFU94805.1 hypothetical protein YIM_48400 [Amycolatopsis sp. YIM 10]
MAKTALTVNLHIEGARETLRALSALPKDASKELRDASLELSKNLAVKVKASGMADSAPQSAHVASTVRAERDRVPVISAGGNKKLGRNRAPAWALLFGSIFGMSSRSGWYAGPHYAGSSGLQYHRRHRGTAAYWFFPVVEEEQAAISAAWNRAADNVVRDFSEGG